MWRLRPLRSVLLVDFDNVIPSAGKAALVEGAAEWTRWIARGGFEGPRGRRRKLIIKRCYWNTSADLHRPAFEDAGYAVIVTPSRTRARKSAADIHIAIDALDVLNSKERVDEFIILSGDSDFTYLAERLRSAGKRVVVFSDPGVVKAYVAAADDAIDRDDLIRAGLTPPAPPKAGWLKPWPGAILWHALSGKRRRRDAPAEPPDTGDCALEALAGRLADDLKSRRATILGTANLKRACEACEGFTTEGPSAWLGHGDEAALVRALAASHDELCVHVDAAGRRMVKLAPGVLAGCGPAAARAKREAGRKRRTRAPDPVFDLDTAAARLADAARSAHRNRIGRRGVRRALAAQPGFSVVGAHPWLGFERYRDMLEALAARRADMTLEACQDGGVVVCWRPADAETDAALALALKVLAQASLPLRVDYFAQRLAAAGGPASWREDGWRRSPEFERLLHRLTLAGLEVARTPEPGEIRDRAATAAATDKSTVEAAE